MSKKLNLKQTLLLVGSNTLLYAFVSLTVGKSDSGIFSIIVFVLASFILSGVIVIKTNYTIHLLIEELKRNLIQFNEGNFTGHLKINTNQKELSSVIDQFEKLKNMFNTWVYELLHSAVSIKLSANQINSSSVRTADGMEDLNQNLSEIRQFFEETTGMLTDVAAATTQLSLSSANIAQNSTHAADSVQNANNAAITGSTAVTQLSGSMYQIKDNILNASEVITKLQQVTTEIGEITGTITSIAGQTNMLALNAAIESARAGEHGRGFAVVSEEVRKLSDETRQAADKISDLIHTIQEEVSLTVIAMKQIREEVDKGVELSDNASYNLHNIMEAMSRTVNLVESISQDVNHQSQGTDTISESTQTLAGKGHTGTASVQEIASVAETRLEDVQLNNESVKELLSISDNLENVMEKFDKAIGDRMLAAGSHIAKLHAEKALTSEDLIRLTKEMGLSEIHLLNEEGVIAETSNKAILGFQFSREKGTQTYDFIEILHDSSVKVNQKFSFRDVDGKLFKYTGISIIGKPGIIQCGLAASEVVQFNGDYQM